MTAPLIVIALVILPLAWFAARAVATLARRVQHGGDRSPFLQDLIARAVAAPVFLFGLYLVLQVAGLTQLALSLLGGAGVLGIIFGFAFRDIAENFLASILLSVRRPFQRGDFIDVAGESGAVRSMNTRTTVLESIEGNLIQIPNAVIFKSTIINYTASPARQGTLDVGVGYDASIAEAQTVIADVLRDHGAVMADPEPYVLVDALGASTVNLRGYYWFNGHEYSLLKVRSALLRLVKKALMEREISMPDDAREVIFPDGVPLRKIADEPGDARAAAPSAPDAPPVEPSEDATEAEGELQTEQAASDPRNHRPVDGGGGDLLSG